MSPSCISITNKYPRSSDLSPKPTHFTFKFSNTKLLPTIQPNMIRASINVSQPQNTLTRRLYTHKRWRLSETPLQPKWDSRIRQELWLRRGLHSKKDTWLHGMIRQGKVWVAKVSHRLAKQEQETRRKGAVRSPLLRNDIKQDTTLRTSLNGEMALRMDTRPEGRALVTEWRRNRRLPAVQPVIPELLQETDQLRAK